MRTVGLRGVDVLDADTHGPGDQVAHGLVDLAGDRRNRRPGGDHQMYLGLVGTQPYPGDRTSRQIGGDLAEHAGVQPHHARHGEHRRYDPIDHVRLVGMRHAVAAVSRT